MVRVSNFKAQLSDDAAPQPFRIPRPHRSSHGSGSIGRFGTMRSLATASRGGAIGDGQEVGCPTPCHSDA